MKAENKTHPVRPKFKDTFSHTEFPLPGIYCNVPGAPFIFCNIAEVGSDYHLLLEWPGTSRVGWQVTNRNLVVFEKQCKWTFYLPVDADADEIMLEQSGSRISISLKKRSY